MNISGPPAEVRMVIQVKRTTTGEVETHELVGYVNPDQLTKLKQPAKEQENGSDSLNGCA